jgi:hypothetical protein
MQTMVFGHNTNLRIGNVTFHVQTEDRGASHALIDTTVYFHGRVLHRRSNNYFDLLPLTEDSQQALKLRLDEQHRTVIDEIRGGTLPLAIPPTSDTSRQEGQAAAVHSIEQNPPNEPRKLLLELTNLKSWLAGKHARLLVAVREPNGEPVLGATIRVEIEGSEQEFVQVDMPRISGPEAALVIQGEDHGANGHLRFSLRAKPRVA